MKLTINVSEDEVIDALARPVIVGPKPGSSDSGWEVYLPGEIPCVCDTLKDAARMLTRELLKRHKRGGS